MKPKAAATLHHDQHHRGWQKAVLKGYGHLESLHWMTIDTSGSGRFRCTNPRYHEDWSRPGKDGRYSHPLGATVRHISPDRRPIGTRWLRRCRRCRECRVDRANFWAARAKREIGLARRTWFVTFTVRPEEHRLAELRAMAASRRAGHPDWEAMPAADKERYLLDQFRREFTLYWMRLRKYSKAKLRYVRVAELHPHKKRQSDGSATSGTNAGKLHFHALIHDYETPLLKKFIVAEWKLGFVTAKLCNAADPRVAFYVTKYLAKDTRGRVWASNAYGDVIAASARGRSHQHSLVDAPPQGGFGGGEAPPIRPQDVNPTTPPPKTNTELSLEGRRPADVTGRSDQRGAAAVAAPDPDRLPATPGLSEGGTGPIARDPRLPRVPVRRVPARIPRRVYDPATRSWLPPAVPRPG